MFIFLAFLLMPIKGFSYQPRFSTAGFYELPNTGRKVYSMNMAWRFHKGSLNDMPWRNDYDDKGWETVSLPNGIELLPVDASGGVNYQGEVWYRKHFIPSNDLKGKKLFLHFEGIMGKCKVWINGILVKEHFGGYLPVIVSVDNLKWNQDNIITVLADNSNDGTYPVGQPQELLDFTYFGGIYRDCWLIAHNNIFITDPNYENEVAGGGFFISYDRISEESAAINFKTHIRNESGNKAVVHVVYELTDSTGAIVKVIADKINLKNGDASYSYGKMQLRQPHLWSPESPYLYRLNIFVKDNDGNVIDGYQRKIGIRSVEFKQADGLWINGKPYGKIMGTNRHQDFAVVGNALPNIMQWRDAKKLRDAGLKVIRTHYVIDPAFMDACDELGLFALVETPGWH
jgi:beta-galactosidase